MDTHNVSTATEYLQYLHRHKKTLQNAQFLKGRRPTKTKSRDEIKMQFMFRRMMTSNAPVGLDFIRSSFLPSEYAPCITPMSDLKKVMIQDLTLETHHRGSYILLRAVTPADSMTAVMAIVEDEEKNVLMLQLYNQEEDLFSNGRLSEGTVVIVKEPYFKVMSDGDHGIRVDHLSDVRFIPEHDILMPSLWRRQLTENETSANSWKTKGNNFFNEFDYQMASDCYSKALDSSPTAEEARTIKLNRALTYLKIHHFEAALRDLETASSGYKPSEKALFRKSQALYHLQNFRESCEVYKVLGKEYPGSTTAKIEFNRAIARLVEQESGKYRFKQLQLEATKRRPPHLDHATYIGPVAVRPTESRGRGLFTTETVKAGDLLFCEKAFAHAFYDADGSSKGLALSVNTQTDVMTVGTQADLIGLIVQKLYKNPSLLSTFTDLYHGLYKPVNVSEVDGKPVVDTFLVERIVALNGFGCPLTSRESHIRTMRDEAKLENSNKQFHSCGVWSLASYINHSCYSNARRSFIGDMMVVRATRDLAPNTEITHWYRSPLDKDSKERKMNMRLPWGFKCCCIICQDFQTTKNSDLTKRTKLTASLQKAFLSGTKPNIPKIEAVLSNLEKTYSQPACEVPRLSIWSPCLILAMIYAAHAQPQKTIEFALKALESLGYIVEGGQLPHFPGTSLLVKEWGLMTDDLVGCWMCLSGAYREVAPDLVVQAEDYARITYRICIGEDETFGETYGRFSGRADGLLATAR